MIVQGSLRVPVRIDQVAALDTGYRQMVNWDWNLRSCGRHGHVTYAPDEDRLRAALEAQTPLGVAWRCLRCGDFVPGEPRGTGPAADAPEVRRGRALRDVVILRLLSAERIIRGLVVLLGAYAVYRFRGHQGGVQAAFAADLPDVERLAEKFHWDIAHSSLLVDVEKIISTNRTTLGWVAFGLLVYGLLQWTEAVGLWLLQRWGEYFAAVATALFIPLEIREIVEKVTWVRIVALIINIAAVVYLIVTKRLFGVRGGRSAYEAERHEASLLEVEGAADGRPGRRGSAPAAASVTAGANPDES